jgi:PTH2 family peptidyl-tRNA hydrolase
MKQVILVRTDLKMRKGKLSGQVAHASIGAARTVPDIEVENWIDNHDQRKIILKVSSLEEMRKYKQKCVESGLNCVYEVINKGDNQIPLDEVTCLGVGPVDDEMLNEIFKDLKLL